MTTKLMRDIIRIDEELCDGCGECVPNCAEGAIRIIDGKARLVAENLCDGIGACLGTCPRGAITIEKRAADPFDESAAPGHGTPDTSRPQALSVPPPGLAPAGGLRAAPAPAMMGHPGGCPGSAVRSFVPGVPQSGTESAPSGEIPSTLTQWPVQLMLVPPTAPFLAGKEVLLAADCCGFAYGDFHRRFLAGKALLVACPKLDNLAHYRQKLEILFRQSGCTGVTVMIMEVPCCGGLKAAALEAYQAAGAGFPLREVVIGIRGDILRQADLA